MGVLDGMKLPVVTTGREHGALHCSVDYFNNCLRECAEHEESRRLETQMFKSAGRRFIHLVMKICGLAAMLWHSPRIPASCVDRDARACLQNFGEGVIFVTVILLPMVIRQYTW